jgi:hypothetical protein
VLKDHRFALLPVAQIRRRDLIELRDRLRDKGVAINTTSKVSCAAKIVLAEAFFRGDIDDDQGAGVGEVKYKEAERSVLLPSEVSGILVFLRERSARLFAASSGVVPVKP